MPTIWLVVVFISPRSCERSHALGAQNICSLTANNIQRMVLAEISKYSNVGKIFADIQNQNIL